MTDTIIVDIDIVANIKNDILFNSDLSVPDLVLKRKIMETKDNLLMRTVNTIGSPKKIISADVVDYAFLNKNLIKNKNAEN